MKDNKTRSSSSSPSSSLRSSKRLRLQRQRNEQQHQEDEQERRAEQERRDREQQRHQLKLAEERDLADLREIAAYASKVEFDPLTGRPIFAEVIDDDDAAAAPAITSKKKFDRHRLRRHPPSFPLESISGIVKVSALPSQTLSALTALHDKIKSDVGAANMVPWAGVGQDTTRLRGFGFPGQSALDRLDASGVRLYAAEKESEGDPTIVLEDERANRRACLVLTHDDDGDGYDWLGMARQAVQEFLNHVNPVKAGLDAGTMTYRELVALQPNLHNGARHLMAHVDWPRHEGFGKVIVTVAIRGSATILLIGPDFDETTGVQPAWKFRLEPGEAYVLSGRARNRCLHAVLADDDNGGGNSQRESLNLRFGLHTAEQAEEEVLEWWSDQRPN